MAKYRSCIIWTVIFAVLMAGVMPVSPVNAASLGDILGGKSSGIGIFDILIGLFVGNLLNKVGDISATNKAGAFSLPDSGGNSQGKEVIGFYAEWWGEDTSSYNSMIKNTDTINTIVPFWATLKADGSVVDRGGNDHLSVVKAAKQHNIKTYLMVNNATEKGSFSPIHNVLSDSSLRTVAIDNLEAYIKKYGLKGINIDFETVPAEDRDNLTAFMQELSERLKPQGYVVSIDVFPKTNEDNEISIAYDYAELAKCVDKIMIMAYDNHGVWSGPGPIADVRWVEDNLKYALKFIPKNKLYLGIAGYGYDWSSKGVEAMEYGPITNLIKQFGADVKWDDPSDTPWFTYTGPDGVRHTVWYENKESLKFKLNLVNKYDLAGVALWKLGEEDPGYWQVFKDKLHLK
ncbi:MAG: hypothetical protein H6Q74_1095 [Firmicutes bacterium]|nr:hypothetical protein [Bacillota bacterium]